MFGDLGLTLAEAIEEDLVGHIRGGTVPPYALNLAGIAGHFGVSAMPARVAVEALVEDRYLIRGGNGRLTINGRRRATGGVEVGGKVEVKMGADQVLTEHVVRMSLIREAGSPEYLREEATAEQFGIGRTVVRRVLSHLAGAGMIRHVPRCGWQVEPYREEDMLEYLEMREMLELRAVDLAWGGLEKDRLEKYLVGNTPRAEGAARLDNGLHGYWIELAGNRYITAFLDQYGVYYEAIFDYAALAASIVAEMAGEHRAILEAMLVGDKVGAKRALVGHIRGQRPNVSKMFECLGDGEGTSSL